MNFNYQKICSRLLEDLPQRQREVLSRRFGLTGLLPQEKRLETLESIGRSYGITRERVRQIEKEGFLRLKRKIKSLQKVFSHFKKYLQSQGGLKKEDILLEELGGKREKREVYFLLTLGPYFERFRETDDFYPLWTINKKSLTLAKKVINSFVNQLERRKKLLALKSFKLPFPLSEKALISYLEVSKRIQKNEEGLFGLKEWPEINPRGVKDKAYLVFKREKRPLHFAEVAELIEGGLVQTVHNELIKDSRFVLIGRGIYALREWGYEPGQVKDVIIKILKEAQRPLSKEEILEKVLKQRLVKKSTVLLNLSDKRYFLKTPQGYIIRKA